MNEILNCPNCGAPITGETCEYCGTVIYDFSVIDDTKPSYIKMKLNGQIIMFKAYLRNAIFEMSSGLESHFYADNNILCRTRSIPDMTVTTEFMVIPDDNILYRIKKEE